MAHDWPGNIRELENAIERAFILCTAGYIGIGHLPEELTAHLSAKNRNCNIRSAHDTLDLQAILDAIERNDYNREAMMIMIARQKAVKLFFTKIDIWLIITEMTLLPLFFYGQYTSSYAHRESIMPFFMFNHQYFWYGLAILLLLIILPAALVIKLLEIKEEHGDTLTHDELLKMNLSAIIVLLGGLIIRFSFVYAGQLSHL